MAVTVHGPVHLSGAGLRWVPSCSNVGSDTRTSTRSPFFVLASAKGRPYWRFRGSLLLSKRVASLQGVLGRPHFTSSLHAISDNVMQTCTDHIAPVKFRRHCLDLRADIMDDQQTKWCDAAKQLGLRAGPL